MEKLKNSDVVILSAKRSPIGRRGKALADWTAPQLAGPVIAEAVRDAKTYVSRVIMGHVLSCGVGQHPAKQAAIASGLLDYLVPAHSVNRVCASSLQALLEASHYARLYDEIVVAGGMESMSQATDEHMVREGLTDAYGKGACHMGNYADELFQRCSLTLSREKQDEFSAESHRRAKEAESTISEENLGLADGYPITFDEGIRDTTLEKLSALPAVFGETITAGNASQLSDGAAALVVTSYKKAKDLRLEPMARIVAFGEDSMRPDLYTMAPVDAAQSALRRARMEVEDIDLFEVNEAFAVVPLYFMSDLMNLYGSFHHKLNIWGGAIALGHPIGASGARIVVTLLRALRHTGGRYGLAVACHGGGGAVACIVENIQR